MAATTVVKHKYLRWARFKMTCLQLTLDTVNGRPLQHDRGRKELEKEREPESGRQLWSGTEMNFKGVRRILALSPVAFN